MNGNDPYPPGKEKNTSEKRGVFKGNNPENDEKVVLNEDSEEYRECEDWDGSEAELVLDDEVEEYEEETTGIKIKYTLKSAEIGEYIKHSNSYQKNKKEQKKHTAIQGLVILAMLAMGFFTQNQYYLWLAAFPVVALLLIWIFPFFVVKNTTKNLLRKGEMTVEIFPDRIEVEQKESPTTEILLDGSCETEELGEMILMFSSQGLSLIIPLRAIEPEFRAEVQAMIIAGARPRYEE